ncbi:LOW QUALITY PROTEIN: hypothetical protein HID58_085510, partial [Brassica napus]
ALDPLSWLLLLLPRLAHGDTASSRASTDPTSVKPFSVIYFNCYGITMFDDQAIERSQIIAPALTQAIRESRISIVVLSKNAMPLLADPSDVQKQTGDFGKVFSKTCRRKREEESQRWSEALTDWRGGQLPQIKQNIYPNRYVINQSFTRSPCLALVEIFFLPPPNLRSSLTSHHFSFFLISYLSLLYVKSYK